MNTKKIIIIISITIAAGIALGGLYYYWQSQKESNIYNQAIEKGSDINIQDAAKSNTSK